MVHSRIHELFVVGSATRTNRVSPRGWPGSMRAHTPTLPPTRHGRRPRRIHSLYACAVRGGGGGRGVPRGVGCAPLQTTGAEFLATVTRGIVALVFLWRRCPPGGWRTSATTAQTMTVTPSSSPPPRLTAPARAIIVLALTTTLPPLGKRRTSRTGRLSGVADIPHTLARPRRAYILYCPQWPQRRMDLVMAGWTSSWRAGPLAVACVWRPAVVPRHVPFFHGHA